MVMLALVVARWFVRRETMSKLQKMSVIPARMTSKQMPNGEVIKVVETELKMGDQYDANKDFAVFANKDQTVGGLMNLFEK
jgi:hypothetical protein